MQSIASSTGVLAGGGNGGTGGAPGGNGGRVRVWAQLPSLILLQLVDTTGGTGTPAGIDGLQQEEAAPTALSIAAKTGTLSFTTNSPDAEGYRIFASLAGAPAQPLMTTKTGSALLPKVAPCVKADYTLSAFMTGVGWQSDPIGPVSSWRPRRPRRPVAMPPS